MSKWDFSLEGRIKQAQRMKFLSDGVVMVQQNRSRPILFVPHKKQEMNSMQTLLYGWTLSKKEDTKIQTKCLKSPDRYKRDYHVAKWFDDTHVQLVPIVERFMKKQNTTPSRICGPENGER